MGKKRVFIDTQILKYISSEIKSLVDVLATVINGVAMQEACEYVGLQVRMQTAIKKQSDI